MSFWLEKSYLNQISSSLRNFKWKGPEVANFSCPYCNDSASDSRKARGYTYTVTDGRTFEKTLNFRCHNCGKGGLFIELLEKINPTLLSEFKLESFKERGGQSKTQAPPKQSSAPQIKQVPVISTHNEALINAAMLSVSHPAVVYLKSRCIPDLSRFYWADNFLDAIHSISPETKISLKTDSRICLIMKDKNKVPFGIIGRHIDPLADKKFRYMTIKFDKDFPKIFGLDSVNTTRTTFVTEGPIDSLYLPNAVALCGGSMSFETLESLIEKENAIIVMDNEPRKKETVEHIRDFAKAGYRVVIWKDMPTEYKDISDMVCKGNMCTRDILKYIASHTYSGLSALQELNLWKRI